MVPLQKPRPAYCKSARAIQPRPRPRESLLHKKIVPSPAQHAQSLIFTENAQIQGYDATTGAGAFYYFIPIMIYFIITVNEILYEKEKKLRQGI